MQQEFYRKYRRSEYQIPSEELTFSFSAHQLQKKMTKWWPSAAPPIPPPSSGIPPPQSPPLFLSPHHYQRRRQRKLQFALSKVLALDHHHGLGTTGANTRRRTISILLLFPFVVLPTPPGLAVEEENQVSLELYMDKTEGFAVLHPSSWLKVEKAGATVLFEDVKAKGNSIGIVVNPVKLSSLRDFGTPQFVAEKLIQAERRKESTKDAQIITALERLGHEGLPVYEFEYTLDSTRGGMKRIFSAAFVMSRKLYLLNITHSDRSDSPLDDKTRTILEQVLHSFDVEQL